MNQDEFLNTLLENQPSINAQAQADEFVRAQAEAREAMENAQKQSEEAAKEGPGRITAGNIDIWGVLKPVIKQVHWNGVIWEVAFHILTADEEMAVADYVASVPEPQRIITESCCRLSYAMESVNGKPIEMTLPQKFEWVKKWPGTLVDAVLFHYAIASREPMTYLGEMLDDPNIVAALSASGVRS